MQGSLLTTLPQNIPKSSSQNPNIWGTVRRSSNNNNNNSRSTSSTTINNNNRNSSTNLSSSTTTLSSSSTNRSTTQSTNANKDFPSMFSMSKDLRIFQGTFEAVRSECRKQHKWLIIHLHSRKEFSAWGLIRDVWNDPYMIDLLNNYFIFWQQDDEIVTERKTDRGNIENIVTRNATVDRLLRYYDIKHEEYPMIMLIDPRAADLVWLHQGTISLKNIYERLANFLVDHTWENPKFIDRIDTTTSQEDITQNTLRKELRAPVNRITSDMLPTATSLSSSTNNPKITSTLSSTSSTTANSKSNKRSYQSVIDDDNVITIDDDDETEYKPKLSPSKKRHMNTKTIVSPSNNSVNMITDHQDSEDTDYGFEFSDDDENMNAYNSSVTKEKKKANNTIKNGTNLSTTGANTGTTNTQLSNTSSVSSAMSIQSTTNIASHQSSTNPTTASSTPALISSTTLSSHSNDNASKNNHTTTGQKRPRDTTIDTHHYNHHHSYINKHTPQSSSNIHHNSDIAMNEQDDTQSQMIHLPTVFNSPNTTDNSIPRPSSPFSSTGNILQKSTHQHPSVISNSTTLTSSTLFHPPPEPSTSADPSSITRIRLRLPNGTVLTKKVYLQDPVTILYAFVSYHLHLPHPLSRKYNFESVDGKLLPMFHISTVIPPIYSLQEKGEQGKRIGECNLANVTLVVSLA